jgi:protease-4
VLPRGAPAWLRLRLAPPFSDLPEPRLPFARRERPSLIEMLRTLEFAATDPRIAGVVLSFSGAGLGMSRALSLRRAVDRLRAEGKPVVAWADSLESETLLVASGAERLYLPESGGVFLVGLRLEGWYLRGLLDRFELRPDVVHVGAYKTAGEYLTRESMSPEQREQLEALADDLFEAQVAAVASGRGLSPAAVRELVDRGPYPARAAVEAGLADGCLYPDELDAVLAEMRPESRRPGPDSDRVHRVEATSYHARHVSDPGWVPLARDLPRIAYVVARGNIRRGVGPRGIASDRVRELIDGLREEQGVCGIVLRIESPGGEAVASDLLWRSVTLVSRDKPVVVSMGDVVASGGYYMAAAADALFAEAGTITGSIGVVAGKLDAEGFYRRVGVAKDGVERGARAGLLSEARGFTQDERAALHDNMSELYGTFVTRVAEGRGLSGEAVEKIARGRIWSGARALELGLVDSIGGPIEALGEVKRRAGLGVDERVLIECHPRHLQLPSLRALSRFTSGRLGPW